MSENHEPAIVCAEVCKSFSGKYAVHDAELIVRPGTVHALVGENGAGKSTLLGMISGRISADSGTITVYGERLESSSPREVRAHGLTVVYQELTMVPAFSAIQNVFLGQLQSRGGLTRDRAMRERYLQLCNELGVEIPADTAARDLSISQQQLVEIMRGIQSRARIFMLDEPSAALAENEREVLYRVLQRLRAAGTTIVIVSHNLDEVLALSDDITVMRDGQVVTSAPRASWDKPALVRSMVGKNVVLERRTDRHPLGGESFSVSDVNLPGVLRDISLTARHGEIVGLWGLVGSGRTTFFRAVCGLEPKSSGTMTLDGRHRSWPRSMRSSTAAGVVMVPESRRDALVMGMDAVDNYWLGRRPPRRFIMALKRERAAVERDSALFGFNPRRIGESVRRLSGGNQQKVLLAKWAGHQPRVLLVDEPTRGIDVGAKAEVLSSLVRLAKDGATVIVTSSELEEVLAICDRLLVFARGSVVRELSTVEGDYSVKQIIELGFGEGESA